MPKSIGIITNNTLLIFSASFGEPRTVLLKRAALLYDHILIPTPMGVPMRRQQFLRLIGSPSVKELDPETATPHYQNLFLHESDVLREPESYTNYVWASDDNDLWRKGGDEYHTHVSGLVGEREIEQFGDQYEAMKFYLPTISMDLKAYYFLVEAVPGACPLVTPHHAATIERFRRVEPEQPERICKQLFDVTVPDFGTLSWATIIDLRSDRFVKDLRRRIAELAPSQSVGSEPDDNALRTLVDSSLWDFVARNEPQLTRTVLGAVAGNLPLPLPFNPIGLISAASDAVSEITMKRKFGWLMFIARLKRLTTNQ